MSPIPGYEGLYSITEDARVWSHPRTFHHPNGYTQHIEGTWKKAHLNRAGYYRVGLVKNGKTKLFRVHRLVAEAFIPNPLNLPEVNHIDANKTNNAISNLEWVDRQRNIQHAADMGLMPRGENHPHAKLTEADVRAIRRAIDKGATRMGLARKYGVDPKTIRDAAEHTQWKEVD